MSSNAKRLLDDVLQFPAEEREVASGGRQPPDADGKLFDSIQAEDPEVETAWQAEIERRITELDDGTVTPIPWTEARRMIQGAD